MNSPAPQALAPCRHPTSLQRQLRSEGFWVKSDVLLHGGRTCQDITQQQELWVAPGTTWQDMKTTALERRANNCISQIVTKGQMFLNFTEGITQCLFTMGRPEAAALASFLLSWLPTQSPSCHPNGTPDSRSEDLICRILSYGYYLRQAMIIIYNDKYPEEEKTPKPQQVWVISDSSKSSRVISDLTLPPYVQNWVEHNTAWKLQSFESEIKFETVVIKFC